MINVHPSMINVHPSMINMHPSMIKVHPSMINMHPSMIKVLDGSPWKIMIRRDLLAQAGGSILHPLPELWKLWA